MSGKHCGEAESQSLPFSKICEERESDEEPLLCHTAVYRDVALYKELPVRVIESNLINIVLD